MPTLSSPLALPCGVDLPNRLAKAAMSEQLGDVRTNAPTDRLTRLYERWAAGGAGLLITGNVMVDRRALGEPRNVAVEDDRDMEGLRAWAEAATQHGTQALVQINHPGRQSPRLLSPSRRAVRRPAQGAADRVRQAAHPHRRRDPRDHRPLRADRRPHGARRLHRRADPRRARLPRQPVPVAADQPAPGRVGRRPRAPTPLPPRTRARDSRRDRRPDPAVGQAQLRRLPARRLLRGGVDGGRRGARSGGRRPAGDLRRNVRARGDGR